MNSDIDTQYECIKNALEVNADEAKSIIVIGEVLPEVCRKLADDGWNVVVNIVVSDEDTTTITHIPLKKHDKGQVSVICQVNGTI